MPSSDQNPNPKPKTVEIFARPEFRVPLTAEEVDLLILLSGMHYDARCKEASGKADITSTPPRINGFLTVWKIHIDLWTSKDSLLAEMADEFGSNPDDRKVHATWDDLDLSLKILEVAGWVPDIDKDLCRKLRELFHGALTAANLSYQHWRVEYAVPQR